MLGIALSGGVSEILVVISLDYMTKSASLETGLGNTTLTTCKKIRFKKKK